MLLERAASHFQAQGYLVKVHPCVIGDSGAIHTPDLHVAREGERAKAVFVFEELDGHGPVEQRTHTAKDMACEPVFVIARPSAEVAQWLDRHRVELVTGEEVGWGPVAELSPPAGPAEPAPIPEAPATPSLLEPEPAAVPERPLTAFPAPEDESDAVLLPTKPRADAPKPRPPRLAAPEEVPEDGGVELLGSSRALRMLEPPPLAAPAPAAPEPEPQAEPEEAGAELLPSKPLAVTDADKVMKHDPSIWDPRARLAQVRQAAKANGFEQTASQGPSSAWLGGLKRR